MKKRILLTALLTGMIGGTANADFYHNNNLLIGDRALGIGGAYTGISDDASGVYYNPAGLGFAVNNDVSGSANARYRKLTTFKDVIPGTDYTEKSEGTISPFFGGLQKIDSGLVFAFAVYSTNNELTNQNDQIVVKQNDVTQFYFDRKLQYKSEDFYVAFALAKRLASNFSIGGSISYFNLYELNQDFQYNGSWGISGTTNNVEVNFLNQNNRTELDAIGTELGFGMQYSVIPSLVLGLSVKGSFVINQKYTTDLNQVRTSIDTGSADCSTDLCKNLVGQVDGSPSATQNSAATISNQQTTISQQEYDDILADTLPLKARFGLAYFASPQLLMAFDIAYSGKAESKEKYGIYDFSDVIDYHAGIEYYFLPTFPMRFGIFTNNDNREEPETSGEVKIDYLGTSLFGSWVQPSSQLGLGVIYQKGDGKSFKVQDKQQAEEVESESIVYAISASHTF